MSISESLKKRIQTAILFGIPVLFLVFFNDWTRIILLSLITILASWEFLSLCYKQENKFVFIVPSMLITCTLLYFAIYKYEPVQYFLWLSIGFNILLLLDLFFLKKVLLTKAPWLSSVLYTSLPLCLLISTKGEGRLASLLIGILLLIWTSDIGAYFSGKNFGRNKLMPSISPGKTWEGFLGAGVLSLLAAYLISLYFSDFSLVQWLGIALAVWLFGSAGDLVESQLKRKLQIKDSGNILPGHGGILDRFDGFYFCIPFVLAYIYFI